MRIFMIVCLSFCAGAAAGLISLPRAVFLALIGVLLLAGIIFLLLRRERRLALILLSAGVGLGWSLGYTALRVAPVQDLYGQEAEISGEAIEYGTLTDYGQWVTAKITVAGTTCRAEVFLPETAGVLAPGDRFTATATLRDSRADGDYYNYAQGVYLTARCKKGAEIVPQNSHALRYLPQRIAHRLEEVIERCFPEDVRGYATALTTGNRALLTLSEKADLQHSGIYHALALSGMHMAVLVGMLGFLGRKKRLALVGIPLCIGFSIVTGGSPSVVRACVMECLLLSGNAFGRESDWPTSLSLSALLLTAQNPWCILSWGLQLSFLSVVGLGLLGGRLYRLLAGKRKKGLLFALRRFLAAGLSATGSAAVMTLPLMAVYFGFISLISPLTNLLTDGVISLCFGGSLITALIGLALPGVGQALGWVLAWGFRYTAWVAGLLSRVPFASVYTDTIYGAALTLLLYFLLLILVLGKGRKIIPVCCGLSACGVCALLILLESMIPSFTALDVGQGQCLVMETGSGAILVDCGGSDGNAGDTAADYLLSHGIRRVALVILTHYDDDHTDGLEELLSRIPVDAVAMPDLESEERAGVEEVLLAHKTPVYLLAQDAVAVLGQSKAEIYGPLSGESDNDAGLSLLMSLPGLRVLITGDMTEQVERLLIKAHAPGHVEVLVAGHHGSRYSTGEALLAETTPLAVVISVGANNTYGHPAQETIDRIAASGAEIFRTDEAGNVTFKGEAPWQR